MLLCVHVASFALAIARRDRPELGDAAILLADKWDRGRVMDCDSQAHASGARAGQTVVQARAAATQAHVVVHDARRTHDVWQDLLDSFDGLSPLVDDAEEGTAYVEMRGVPGTPQTWIAAAREIVRPFDLPVCVAIGPNKFSARAATYIGDATLCTAENARALVASLPIEVLQLDPKTLERLELLGVRRLGELAKLPHGPFVRRFGKSAARWHEQANGEDRTPFIPRAHELQIDAALYGEGSSTQSEQVLFALRVLADRVCADLSRLGKAASQLAIHFECENGDLREVAVGLAQATADPRPIVDVVRAKLESVTFDSPVSGLRMRAVRFEEIGNETGLFARSAFDPQAVAVALARLEATLGSGALRARLQPSACIEMRYAYDAFPTPGITLPSGVSALPAMPVPQMRLLAVREIAVHLKNNAPSQVDGQAVRDCAGPWRVDDGWFESPVARDEYDVLLDDGTLYRIYAQGERWYVRGAYD